MSEDSLDPRVLAAQAEQEAAHRRLGETLGLLKARLAPRVLAGRAVAGVKDGARSGAESAARFVADNPGKTAGVGLAVAGGLFALFRRKRGADRHIDEGAEAPSSQARHPRRASGNRGA